jgi:hypothetical protein
MAVINWAKVFDDAARHRGLAPPEKGGFRSWSAGKSHIDVASNPQQIRWPATFH